MKRARYHFFARRIAMAVGRAERDFQFRIGTSISVAYSIGYTITDETYDMAMAPDRDYPPMRLRTIRT